MLVGFRNTILLGGMLFILLVLGILLTALYLVFFAGEFPLEELDGLDFNPWWIIYEHPAREGTTTYIWVLGGILAILALAFIAGLFLRILFKKTASAELYFFIIFLFTLACEGFRGLNLSFHFYKVPLYLVVFNTRLVYFGRLFGLMMLFCSSLYAMEMKYQKFDIVIGLSALSALLLASSLPLDSSIMLSTFLYRLADDEGVFFINLVLALIPLINFFLAALKRQRQFLLVVLALGLTLAGRELLFYTFHPLMLAAGLGLVVGGILIFSRQIDKIYLWF